MISVVAETAAFVSGSLIFSTLVKATVILGLGLVSARIARTSSAAVRHTLYLCAFAAIAILPIASTFLPSVVIPVASEPQESIRFSGTGDLPRTAPNLAMVDDAAVTGARFVLTVPVVVMSLWLIGVIGFLTPLIAGLWELRQLLRNGRRWEHGEAVVRESAARVRLRRHITVVVNPVAEGPMTFGLIRPVIVMPLDATGWRQEDLRRALVHELEHIRRADWITQSAGRAICALYWFHPMVWTCWRSLRLEAERACDDAVVQAGETIPYAAQLVMLAERIHASRAFLAMANRRDLPARIEAVLDPARRRDRAGMVRGAAMVVSASLLVTGLAPARVVRAQVSATTARRVFEVSSVRPNAQAAGIIGGDCRGVGGTSGNVPGPIETLARAAGVTPTSPGRCRFVRSTLKELIAYAFDVRVTDQRRTLIGGPRWIEQDRFDIEAKSERLVSESEMKLMLQSMLADRFGLQIVREVRQVQGYALLLSPGGHRMESATGRETRAGFSGFLAGKMRATKASMPMLTQFLTMRLHQPVEDATGLDGLYNFTLSWTLNDNEAAAFGVQLPVEIRERLTRDADRSGTSLVDALPEQLGVWLRPQHVGTEVLVITHANRPSEN